MDRFRLLLVASIAALALSLGMGLSPGSVVAEEPPPEPKVCDVTLLEPPSRAGRASLCHVTGSDTNPFIFNEVSVNSLENGHVAQDHHGDCFWIFGGVPTCIA